MAGARRAAPSRGVRQHHSDGALVFVDGRLLVLRRNDRAEWVFPKGHLESGERPEEAATRDTAIAVAYGLIEKPF